MKWGISQNISNLLIQNKIIEEENQELYIYGLHQGFIIILNVITTFLLSMFFQSIWNGIIFLVVYIPLRSYAGGYHAKTELRCFIQSILVLVGVFWSIKHVQEINGIFIFLFVLAGIIIYICSPVADQNKPLSKMEIEIYRKRSRTIVLIEGSAFFISLYMGVSTIYINIFYCFIVLTFLLILGKIKSLKEFSR